MSSSTPPPFCALFHSPEQVRLCEIEDQAKASKKGFWSEGGGQQTIRDLKYTIENPRNFVDSLHQKPVNGTPGELFKLKAPSCVKTLH